jgi:hypothetical protein
MARVNVSASLPVIHTHEGGKAKIINAEMQLRRSVMACMLWEDTFYEDGVEIATRIGNLVAQVKPESVAEIAIEAREKMKLRHVPLLLVRHLAKLGYKGTAAVLERIIQRADELTEFVAIYWKDGKEPLSAQVKRGLAKAFTKFDEYQLAKYDRADRIKLRDVLFLCHAKPKDEAQAALWKRLVDKQLTVPDTWEVGLSAGKDKRETWERLLKEKKLGALALLRNLRNMQQVNVDESLMRESIVSMKAERVLPFRFIAAARYAPQLEPELEQAMFRCLAGHEKLVGKTVLLVDVSGSMDSTISAKSDLRRLDAACGLAMLAREICETVEIWTFSNDFVGVPPRRGFALRDAIVQSQQHGGTYLGNAVNTLNAKVKYDRLIVITDEQAHDNVPDPFARGYVINVAAYKNGIGYGKWVHVDGWSEAIISYLMQYENQNSGLVAQQSNDKQ